MSDEKSEKRRRLDELAWSPAHSRGSAVAGSDRDHAYQRRMDRDNDGWPAIIPTGSARPLRTGAGDPRRIGPRGPIRRRGSVNCCSSSKNSPASARRMPKRSAKCPNSRSCCGAVSSCCRGSRSWWCSSVSGVWAATRRPVRGWRSRPSRWSRRASRNSSRTWSKRRRRNASRLHHEVAGLGAEGALGIAGALPRPVPAAGRADAGRGRPDGRDVLLRAGRAQGHRRRRLGRRLEAAPLRLGIQGAAACGPRRRRLHPAPAICAGVGEPAAADRLRHGAVPDPHELDEQRQPGRTSSRSTTWPTRRPRDRLKWAFSSPERLRPGETRQSLTERAAASVASVAQALRERGHDPQAVAHFV